MQESVTPEHKYKTSPTYLPAPLYRVVTDENLLLFHFRLIFRFHEVVQLV
jgi:hypothetical protein